MLRIRGFKIMGNTLLSTETLERVLEPFKGDGKSYTDIQRALEAIEGAYRKAGYSAVYVVTPEQDVTNGIVIFQVNESVIGKVSVQGNLYFDEQNIRNALPALKEGTTPSARKLSEDVRLANENPSRHLGVVLSESGEENRIDATVNVRDTPSQKFFVTLNNTGNSSTGMYRIGVGYQHNNLFNRDQAATLSYTTSPGYLSHVRQIAGSYRIPLYTLGDSVDLIAAHSSIDAGTTNTIAGLLSFSGQGDVFDVRYNHYLPQAGEYSAKIIYGLDYRAYANNCSLGNFGAAGCGAAAYPVTVHPLSLGYDGTLRRPAFSANINVTLSHNIPGGSNGSQADFDLVRPSPTGGAGAPANYTILRFAGSMLGALPRGLQYRVALSGQYTPDALVSGEGFGLVGANAVRGFLEREISTDKGGVLNLELYSPELAGKLNSENGSSLRLLAFLDAGRGWNVPLAGEASNTQRVASTGVGIRYLHSKSLTIGLDFARVIDSSGTANNVGKTGHERLQLSAMQIW